MKHPFLMHIAVALVWMFLSGNTTLGNFFLALGLTFLLLALFRRPLGCEDYIRRATSLGSFILRLVADIVMSNLRIMRVALRRNAGSIEGFYMAYDVTGLSDFEVLLLSVCVGLSPGTMVADRSADGRELILHVFAAGSAGEIVGKLDAGLKSGILSFTR